MLISGSTRLDVPHETGSWMEFKRLNGKKLQKARDVKIYSAMELGRQFPELLKQAQEQAAAGTVDPAVAAAQADPLNGYDSYKLCELGIKDWGGEPYPSAFTVEQVEDLDDATLEWAARAILRISNVASDPEDVQKNV